MEPSFRLNKATCGRLSPELVLSHLIPCSCLFFLLAFQMENSRIAKPGKKGLLATPSLDWNTGFPSVNILSPILFYKQWP